MDIRKAVILAAGLGTRFLPATKALPKEMIPVVDKPTIQYIVEEIVASGIKEIIIVTGQGKRAIEDHFDQSLELEYFLAGKGKKEELAEIRRISKMAEFFYVRQHRDSRRYGTAPALFTVRHLVGNEPFVVSFGDDIITAKPPVTKSLIDIYNKYNKSAIAVRKVPHSKVSDYGVIAGEEVAPGVIKVTDIVEKPDADQAPSDMVLTGRHVLKPPIFEIIKNTPPGKSGEVVLTEALRRLARQNDLYAYCYKGEYHDTGSKTEFVKTTIDFALKHPDTASAIKDFLKNKKL